MKNTKEILEILKAGVSDFTAAPSSQIRPLARAEGLKWQEIHEVFLNKSIQVKRGVYDLQKLEQMLDNNTLPEVAPASPAVQPVAAPQPVMALSMGVSSVSSKEVYVPAVDPCYIKWGHSSTLEKILRAKSFYPVFISGMSGNGKTVMVEQACAKLKREYVRVQISPETDEDDLIGGFRLLGGETVFQKGPVIKAMEAGAVLLIDEIDRASNKIMCLQGVLEGKPVLIKKTGEVIVPATGFTVMATANTKGRGADDGRYSAATIIDDAFLERFIAAIDQPWPSPAVETKIVTKHMEKFDTMCEEFCEKLVAWANVIRKTFEDEGVEDLISTRRLCHIVHTFSIFGDKMKSIEMCTSRFDEETRGAFMDLYSMVDTGAAIPGMEEVPPAAEATPDMF